MIVNPAQRSLVYHFLNEEFGLQDIKQQRLKLSHIDRLNDPFEHRAIELGDEALRKGLDDAIAKSAQQNGIVCFSKTYHSPVMWSHYAERHKGICLGFEVHDIPLTEIKYIPERLRGEITDIPQSTQDEQNLMLEIIRSKHNEWRYEKEVRLTVSLEHAIKEKGNYFLPFADKLVLRRVLIGAKSTVSRRTLQKALASQKSELEVFKVRAAFKSFKMVRDKTESKWI